MTQLLKTQLDTRTEVEDLLERARTANGGEIFTESWDDTIPAPIQSRAEFVHEIQIDSENCDDGFSYTPFVNNEGHTKIRDFEQAVEFCVACASVTKDPERVGIWVCDLVALKEWEAAWLVLRACMKDEEFKWQG